MDSIEVLSISELSDYSAYREELDGLVDGEDDEWLIRISIPDNETKRTLLFSWLSTISSNSEREEFDSKLLSEPILAAEISCSSGDSQWEASIDSLFDFSIQTDLKLFGVNAEEVEKYSAVDLGLEEIHSDFFEPLELESDKLQLPQDIQKYLEDFAKQIEENEKLGQVPHFSPSPSGILCENSSTDLSSIKTKNKSSFSRKSNPIPTIKTTVSPTSSTYSVTNHQRSFSSVDKKSTPLNFQRNSFNNLTSPSESRIPRFAPIPQPNSMLTSTSSSSIPASRRPVSIASPRDLIGHLRSQSTASGLSPIQPTASKRLDATLSPEVQNQFPSRIPRFNRSPKPIVSPLSDVSNQRGSRLMGQSTLDLSSDYNLSPSSQGSSKRLSLMSLRSTPLSAIDNNLASGTSRIPRMSLSQSGAKRTDPKSKLSRHSVIY